MERRARGVGKGSLEEASSSADGSKTRRTAEARSWSKLSVCAVIVGLLPVVIVGHLAYLAFVAQCPIDPAAKGVSPPPALIGVYSPDNAESLADAKLLFPELWHGAECVTWDRDGVMYTGTLNGEVWKLDPAADEPVLLATTGRKKCNTAAMPTRDCGRPLGIRAMPDKSLLIADGMVGLLKLSLTDGSVTVLVPRDQVIDGKPMLFADDLAIGPDGMVYFSDVSYKYPMEQLYLDILESGTTGRVVRYNPQTGVSTTFADELSFPNGVELSHDRASILVPETSFFRVKRIFLEGARAGQSETLVDTLPGFPDNIQRHPDGGYLIGLSGFRTTATNVMDERPYLRRLLVNAVPYKDIVAASNPYGLCVHVSESGEVLRSWHDAKSRTLGHTAHCAIHRGHLYVGSYAMRGVAKLKLTKSLPTNQNQDD